MNWKVEQDGPVLTMRVPYVRKAGWEQWALLRSDVHHDSLHCDIRLEKKHLDQAVERNAMIFDFGDTFDVMQGRKDPRRYPDDLHPKFLKGEYYDAVVHDAVNFYKPYKDNIVMFCKGNHETTVLRHAQTDLIGRLAFGVGTLAGEYGGWIRFLFTNKTRKPPGIMLRYMHSGPSQHAPVTKGVLNVARISEWLTDADIVYTGHDHKNWIVPLPREGLSGSGKVVRKETLFVKGPGYKDSWGKGDKGWAVEKAFGPTNMGAIWIRFYYDTVTDSVRSEAHLTEK